MNNGISVAIHADMVDVFWGVLDDNSQRQTLPPTSPLSSQSIDPAILEVDQRGAVILPEVTLIARQVDPGRDRTAVEVINTIQKNFEVQPDLLIDSAACLRV